MPDRELPADVLRLIQSVIASMDHVEVLRHLVAAPGDTVTVDEIIRRAHLDRGNVERILRDLERAGIVIQAESGYQYRPSLADVRSIGLLLNAYDERPATLVRAIYARPKPRSTLSEILVARPDEQ